MLSRSLYFTGMEPTRKSKEEGRYLLETANNKKQNAQREADNLLSKYYKKKDPSLNKENHQGRKVTAKPSTHFSSYTSALANKHPITNSSSNITRQSIMNQRPVKISFSMATPSNESTWYPPTFYNFFGQNNRSKYNPFNSTIATEDLPNNPSTSFKKKVMTDNNSIVTQSTIDMTQETS